MLAFGFKSIVEYAKNPKRFLAPVLFSILSANFFFYLLQTNGLWTKWFSYDSPGGIFSSRTVYAIWSAVSFPILIKWKKWAVIPAVIGLLLGRSSTALMSVFAVMAFLYWEKVRLAWKILALIVPVLFVWFVDNGFRLFFMSISQKLYTQFIVLKAIMANPMGIGFGFWTYQKVIQETGVSGTQVILPHPASDFLHFVLRFGIPSIVILALFGLWFFKSIRRDYLSASLVAFIPPIFIQGSLSNPEIGFLAYILLAVFLIERSEYAAWKTKESR